ncbi:hypothetical protein LAZ67_4004203 [Cordylochernes scorpioides]|uniref:Transposase n=1 Tax=Cordylochernes scorpioides TaxID=51811 RepID=A0ABY6KEA9_9ARAC|nr:hypothetical protein LAZ67_4004203 [Cordylochernes scorpioides]
MNVPRVLATDDRPLSVPCRAARGWQEGRVSPRTVTKTAAGVVRRPTPVGLVGSSLQGSLGLRKNWILLHDNARPYKALSVAQYLAKNGTSKLPHPPYSPELSPS